MNGVLILDFGSQYTQLIARRIRTNKVYCQIASHFISKEEILSHQPKAIILSGGPRSVYERDAPKCNKIIFNLGLPILGICYGMQYTVHFYRGKISKAKKREYGQSEIKINHPSLLFEQIQNKNVWMSHGDHITTLPKGFKKIASTSSGLAGAENVKEKIYLLQFHPEVIHTKDGEKIIKNFLFKICHLKKLWTMPSFTENSIQSIRHQVQDKKVVLGLSGGVDSSTLALLLHKAIGDKLTCVFVNNGLLRLNEAEKIKKTFKDNYKIKLKYVNAEKQFLKALKGITHPELKRKIIGKVFIQVFYKACGKIDFLAQGTLYPDVIESISTNGPSDLIKTHHNRVSEVLKLIEQNRVIEPFQNLFKDEVRNLAKQLKLIPDLIHRQPFPGPGLAIRILGEVTKKRLEILRKSDAILLEEIKKAGWYNKLWQSFAVLLPVKSVGVMGDQRTYAHTITLRCVSSQDGMTADFAYLPKKLLTSISNRIIGEIEEINRVTLDISSKPPATIEWE